MKYNYSWSNTPNLVPNGLTAQLTGYKPSSSEYIYVTMTYTSPKGKKCFDKKAIWVCMCYVKISGPIKVKLDDPPITLTAEGYPTGGTYAWSDTPGLAPNGSSAQFTGQSPGDVTIEVTYTDPDGKTCPETHTVTVFGVGSITGPVCVESGTILIYDDFTIVTNPIGFEDLVTISLLVFSTLSQYEKVTVTASCGPGITDDATTIITIVNSNLKAAKNISFEIPNYLNKPLDLIGLGDKTDISLGYNFSNFKECCGFGMSESSGGSLVCKLSIDAGPFTIVGVPIPPKFKEYVAADALNVTLSGEGNVNITGSYKACENNTTWSGGGDLTAGVNAGCMVKAKFPKVIVLKGKIAGSTSITEKLSIEDQTVQRITTNLGGLTGDVSGTIKILKITTNWGGLTASGSIAILIRKRKILYFEASRTCFEKGDLKPVTINLPPLK